MTNKEFALLEHLMLNRGECVSRVDLLDSVWNMEPTQTTNIVDVYVNYLRRKLEDPPPGRLIRTVRGHGYMVPPESELAFLRLSAFHLLRQLRNRRPRHLRYLRRPSRANAGRFIGARICYEPIYSWLIDSFLIGLRHEKENIHACFSGSCSSRSAHTIAHTAAHGAGRERRSQFRQRLTQILTGLRWQVREASGGAEAWAEAEASLPEALIVDSWLPDLDLNEFLSDFRGGFPGVDVLTAAASSTEESPSGPYRQELLYALRSSQENDTTAWNAAPAINAARSVVELPKQTRSGGASRLQTQPDLCVPRHRDREPCGRRAEDCPHSRWFAGARRGA